MSSSHEDVLTLPDCVRLVRRFHERIKAPIAATPQTLLCDPASALVCSVRLTKLSKELAVAAKRDILLSRAALAVEELGEWILANANGDAIAAGDAIADRLYVILGDAVASGLPLQELFEAVHASNMTKLPLVQTGHGHGAKGTAYVPPQHRPGPRGACPSPRPTA